MSILDKVLEESSSDSTKWQSVGTISSWIEVDGAAKKYGYRGILKYIDPSKFIIENWYID